jgi:hypothetical protein
MPPLFIWSPDAGDLLCFESAEAATRGLGAWQEVNVLPAWDSQGRRITFAVEQRRRLLLGVLPVRREVVVLEHMETAPAHADELKRALIASLARRGEDPVSLEQAALAELVKRAVLER